MEYGDFDFFRSQNHPTLKIPNTPFCSSFVILLGLWTRTGASQKWLKRETPSSPSKNITQITKYLIYGNKAIGNFDPITLLCLFKKDFQGTSSNIRIARKCTDFSYLLKKVRLRNIYLNIYIYIYILPLSAKKRYISKMLYNIHTKQHR